MPSTLPAGLSIAIAGVLSAAMTVVGMGAAPAGEETQFLAASAGQPHEPLDPPPLEDVRPEPRFLLAGSGNGHSVGMSQWGAYSLGRQGRGYEEILHHYYTDVEIGAHPDAAADDPLHVNLFHGNTRIEDPGVVHLEGLAAEGRAPAAVTMGPDGEEHALPRDTRWTVEHTDEFVLRDADGAEIDRGPGPVQVSYSTGGEPTLRLPQFARSDETHEGALNRGRLEITAGDDALRPVVVLGMEDYLLGVEEVPGGWPGAALQAQAVTARTYAAGRFAAGLREDCACHLITTVADQVYVAYGKEGAAGASRWIGAVQDTAGQAVTYEGELIEAVYSAAHAGRSENVEDSWAFGGDALPYLRSVVDPWVNDPEAVEEYDLSSWEHEIDHAALADLAGLDTIARVAVALRTIGGSPRVLNMSGWDEDGTRVENVTFGSEDGAVAAAALFLALREDGVRPPSQQFGEIRFSAFDDVLGSSPHAYNIAAIAEEDIAAGRDDGTFAPNDTVRRDQMATFLARALDLRPDEEDRFDDVPVDSVHREAINAVAKAGIAEGFGDGRFGPSETVTRDQMATFLARGFDLPPVEEDHFSDIADSVHREAINAVAEDAITAGCGGTLYCPRGPVTRGQMASFLARGLGYGW